mmetsp:Transcript_16444/g.38056  ORF Transcript_16444/g.38056 Transcript_16444/m.38056 type:complete len:296 (-) Transcript_16444:212-1099(-)|eukprot:CAMPEP_0197173030 /NCGR_PEP_ID=MMETSP1423-20130617/95_1 /TAXON_ID=476441 /ORGANISM="Pseudo-nitzschia heimii, Strain UNC1101" /LENGTH=295 /DNA_ID=CAMNT_0042621775 /DNA_START=76 /DNA_END=963 /DNA_ORIENTATION=+
MTAIAAFGVTGNIGKHLLPLLAIESAVEEIRILTKRPESIESEVHNAKAEGKTIVVKKADYCSDETVVTSTLRGCHRLFVVLPQSSSSQDIIRRGKFLADCALASGVGSIVRISSLGIDQHSMHFIGSQGPLGDAHIAVEKYCAEIGLKHVSLRPTSLFSNINFNVDEIASKSRMSTPLGIVARVNWVSCEDVAKVAAKVLVARKWDEYGRVIDVTGPPENTVSAEEMAQIVSESVGKSIEYKELDIPPVPDYGDLWRFLRRGGYDCDCDNVETITGNSGQRLSETKIVSLQEQA